MFLTIYKYRKNEKDKIITQKRVIFFLFLWLFTFKCSTKSKQLTPEGNNGEHNINYRL